MKFADEKIFTQQLI